MPKWLRLRRRYQLHPAGRAHLVCQPLKVWKHVRPGFHGHQVARLQEAAIDPAPGVHNGSRRRRACEEGAGGHAIKDKLQHSARNEEALLWSYSSPVDYVAKTNRTLAYDSRCQLEIPVALYRGTAVHMR